MLNNSRNYGIIFIFNAYSLQYAMKSNCRPKKTISTSWTTVIKVWCLINITICSHNKCRGLKETKNMSNGTL